MMNKIIVLGILLTLVFVQGCSAPLMAKFGQGSKPELFYAIEDQQIIIDVNSFSSKLSSIRNMAEVSVAMLADNIADCRNLLLTYENWPLTGVKVNSTVAYECTSKPPTVNPDVVADFGGVIDVQKKLRFNQDLVSVIQHQKLLKPKN